MRMGNIQQATKKRTSTKTLARAPPRAPQTYNVHEDSVWALQASEDWSLVYSGGRDKCVYRTHLHTRTAELLAHEQHPVRKMALDQQVGTGWWALVLLGGAGLVGGWGEFNFLGTRRGSILCARWRWTSRWA